MKKIIIFICIINAFKTAAQKLPDTDIFLIKISQQNNMLHFDSVMLMAKWDEYDNQPSFSATSDRIYYSSLRDADKTNVCIYFISNGNATPYIESNTLSQFSPMEMPGGNGISVVCQKADGTQQLWEYNTDGTDLVCLTPDMNNVGYYCWLNKNQLVIRREGVDTNNILQLYNIDTKIKFKVSEAPGISLYKVPNENSAYYIDKSKPVHRLMKFYADSLRSDSLTTVPNNIDDFTATVFGDVWIISNGKILSWSPAAPGKWNVLKELTGDLTRGYRLSVSRDMKLLAIVTKEKSK